MLPLDYKEPYIKANGSRSTLGEMFEEAGAEVAQVKAELDNEIKARAALGAHNLFPVTLAMIKKNNGAGSWADNVLTKQGITWTFTANSAGYITEIDADGQLSEGVAYTAVNLSVAADNLDFGATNKNDKTAANATSDGYTLSSGADGIGGDDSVYIAYFATDKTTALRIDGANKSVSHHKFYPMYKLASDADTTFTPYAATNQELTNKVGDISNNISLIIPSAHNQIYSTSPVISDCNNAVNGVWYYVYGSAINRPSSDNTGILLTYGQTDTTGLQLYFAIDGIWIRQQTDDTWGAWSKLTS